MSEIHSRYINKKPTSTLEDSTILKCYDTRGDEFVVIYVTDFSQSKGILLYSSAQNNGLEKLKNHTGWTWLQKNPDHKWEPFNGTINIEVIENE